MRNDGEGFCAERDDAVHCEHWWDGAPCCSCGRGATAEGAARSRALAFYVAAWRSGQVVALGALGASLPRALHVQDLRVVEGGGDHWEEIDAGDFYWGVFGCDDTTPSPMAIFSDEEAAERWLAWMREHPDEDLALGGGDYCVMPIRDLKGFAWNYLDPAPGSCALLVTKPWKFRDPGYLEACGEATRGGSYGGEPRCPRHEQPGADR